MASPSPAPSPSVYAAERRGPEKYSEVVLLEGWLRKRGKGTRMLGVFPSPRGLRKFYRLTTSHDRTKVHLEEYGQSPYGEEGEMEDLLELHLGTIEWQEDCLTNEKAKHIAFKIAWPDKEGVTLNESPTDSVFLLTDSAEKTQKWIAVINQALLRCRTPRSVLAVTPEPSLRGVSSGASASSAGLGPPGSDDDSSPSPRTLAFYLQVESWLAREPATPKTPPRGEAAAAAAGGEASPSPSPATIPISLGLGATPVRGERVATSDAPMTEEEALEALANVSTAFAAPPPAREAGEAQASGDAEAAAADGEAPPLVAFETITKEGYGREPEPNACPVDPLGCAIGLGVLFAILSASTVLGLGAAACHTLTGGACCAGRWHPAPAPTPAAASVPPVCPPAHA